MTIGPLAILRDTAAEHHAVLVDYSGDWATFTVAPPRPSGAPPTIYRIRVTANGSTVSAQEETTSLLPGWCPERHINGDGSFCLYWAEAEPLVIASPDEAREWWTKLLAFLRRQDTARSQRRWPGKADARAHGPEAARHQAEAERLAVALGETFVQNLKSGRFTTKRHAVKGEHRIQLLRDGRKLISVVERHHRVMTQRALCKCDEAERLGLPLRSCGIHARELTAFTLAIDGWRRAEQKFSKTLKDLDFRCCGTLDECPLAI
ncbi:E2 domain-associated cysteine-rich protein [Microvirga sp. 2MCAF35]|uniref:E2 domain-associated cysteine-rich protein n=1 Tax=Microvirga sp. 2MCAF35 TaxID=3232987 RepID=UPI003F95D0D1